MYCDNDIFTVTMISSLWHSPSDVLCASPVTPTWLNPGVSAFVNISWTFGLHRANSCTSHVERYCWMVGQWLAWRQAVAETYILPGIGFDAHGPRLDAHVYPKASCAWSHARSEQTSVKWCLNHALPCNVFAVSRQHIIAYLAFTFLGWWVEIKATISIKSSAVERLF